VLSGMLLSMLVQCTTADIIHTASTCTHHEWCVVVRAVAKHAGAVYNSSIMHTATKCTHHECCVVVRAVAGHTGA
jgi:hypothetical protein